MMGNLEQPKIDVKKIQKAANAAAEKAYLSSIEDYYTSYSSPFKKMIKAELDKQEFKWSMELPNILSKINQSLSDEIDIIANNSIANTYIPMVNNALVGLEKELKLSTFLKLVIEALEPERDVFDDFSFEYNKNDSHGWLNCVLYTSESNYEFTLHETCAKKGETQKYQLLSMPGNKYKTGYNSNMTIYKGDVKVEMPFTPNILHDKVLNLFFKMMLGTSKITIDCDGFSEDMFPEDEHCHC